jgi:PBSX family phage portal protein
MDHTDTTDTTPGKDLCFSFGDPDPVLSSHLTDYLGVFQDVSGDFYRPPIDLMGLARLMGANPYHGPILHFKKNMVLNWYINNPLLSADQLAAAALDYVVTANCYFQKIRDQFGRVVRLVRLPSLLMRATKNPDVYVKLLDTPYTNNDMTTRFIKFQPGEVIHLKEQDVRQNIYGIPQYYGGIQSVLLSEDATLFKRKYFINGAHMGYILVTTDANLGDETAKAIEKAVKDSKGPGNFRNLYLNIPRSTNKTPVQILPVGSIGSKEEFSAIKEITEMEMIAMHRVYPGLVAILPANIGGFGDLEKSLHVYYDLEIKALQSVFLQLNQQIPGNRIAFTEPDWKQPQPTA